MKRKFIGLLFTALIFTGCATQVGTDLTDTEEKLIDIEVTERSTIVCFGDSLTYGHGLDSATESWPALLQKRVAIPVINAGIDDNTTEDAVVRFETDVLDHNPAIVIFDFGGNDIYYLSKKVSYSNIEKNFRIMLDQLDLTKTQVYIMRFYNNEMKFLDPFGTFDKILLRLEEDYPVIIIWDAWSGAWGHKEYKLDMTHCNAEGYKIMEQHIFDALQPCLEKNDLLK